MRTIANMGTSTPGRWRAVLSNEGSLSFCADFIVVGHCLWFPAGFPTLEGEGLGVPLDFMFRDIFEVKYFGRSPGASIPHGCPQDFAAAIFRSALSVLRSSPARHVSSRHHLRPVSAPPGVSLKDKAFQIWGYLSISPVSGESSFPANLRFRFLMFPDLDLGRSSWPPPTARPMKKVGTVKFRGGSPLCYLAVL
jgi:hypothetical protein